MKRISNQRFCFRLKEVVFEYLSRKNKYSFVLPCRTTRKRAFVNEQEKSKENKVSKLNLFSSLVGNDVGPTKRDGLSRLEV
jgi:hypothetical protein